VKRLVYACVLTLSVAPFVNCAPKDKLLRQPNTKDSEVTEMEIAKVSGLDYTYYLSVRAAEAKQLLELALSKDMKQPEKSCVSVDPQNNLNGVEKSKVVADCIYESGANKIDFKSSENLFVEKDKDGEIYNVSLEPLGFSSASMKPKKEEKGLSKNIALFPMSRSLEVSYLPQYKKIKKGDKFFDVTYSGSLSYEQNITANRLKTFEKGVQTFTLRGIFRLEANKNWSLISPTFEFNINAVRTLTNTKKKNKEQIIPKEVNVKLMITGYKGKDENEQPVEFVGDCDRLVGILDVVTYDHKTNEKGFKGPVGMDENVMAAKKSGTQKVLPKCEKRAVGYNIQTPLDVIFLK